MCVFDRNNMYSGGLDNWKAYRDNTYVDNEKPYGDNR